mmetsp:Transcript_76183/g.131858  ORF Transcript_76183/g.131858 Transcript_76183/m.131858 type:complete len:250 (-) Transcript_76183:219-968(-)
MVVSASHPTNTLWRWLIKSSALRPGSTTLSARSGIVELRLTARAFSFLILRLSLIVAATRLWLMSEHCNVVPRRWMPVRIVITFFWAFQTMTLTSIIIAVRILACCCGSTVVPDILICSVKTFVSLAILAGKIELQRFVLSSGGISSPFFGWRFLLATCYILIATFCSIPDLGVVALAHVLQNHLALCIRAAGTTSVLGEPLYIQLRALIVLHDPLHGAFLTLIVVPISILTSWLAIVTYLVPSCSIVL